MSPFTNATSNWPANNPFHEGEVVVQKRLGTHRHVMAYAPRMIRPAMPDQHREFFAAQPFLVVAARDDADRMWASLVAGSTTSPDPKTLEIHGQPVPGDALEGALTPGTDVGLLGIEFATKRRNRVNGRIIAADNSSGSNLVFQVDQSFGNCPQYIKPRQWWTTADKNDPSCAVPNRSDHLSKEQMAQIHKAETIFVATGYRPNNNTQDPRYGNDASHRGGPAGFVLVQDNRTLILPDFSGNHHYNTIGNLEVDPRMGITFPQYETGALLQVTGRATVDFDELKAAAVYPGAERLLYLEIDQVVHVPEGSFPIRWSSKTAVLQERKLVVSAKIEESKDVMSFHLRPLDKELQSLWKFQPGQHLPIALKGADPFHVDANLERTYSISAGPDWGEYRISVKRQGLASSFLHDKITIGDILEVKKPAGDFCLDKNSQKRRPLVLLSNGIGATPLISMLHQWANSLLEEGNRRPVYWIHGARDSHHHPFGNEVEEIRVGDNKALLTTHVAYSQPLEGDTTYDSKGRLTVDKVAKVVSDLVHAEIYMCGTSAFLFQMEEDLSTVVGVPSSQIHYETF